ncbi:hypothetical protein [Hymenobacter pini]|uniref:hypothetical protein n=1 Tax=Hymenobacter pini TaxID=2880879 RepID=UPI001CF16D5D|nr:hypothetical protein [Hymenobacter pini]MCA8831152.1 hypothetical protein [Hymenobacter pini]
MSKYTVHQKEFANNLRKVVERIADAQISYERVKFIVKPEQEPGKHCNSFDDLMRLTVFRNKDFENRIFSSDEVIELFTGANDRFPLWIHVRLREDGIIELLVSMRFRKFRELLYQEMGHPPFKVIE